MPLTHFSPDSDTHGWLDQHISRHLHNIGADQTVMVVLAAVIYVSNYGWLVASCLSALLGPKL